MSMSVLLCALSGFSLLNAKGSVLAAPPPLACSAGGATSPGGEQLMLVGQTEDLKGPRPRRPQQETADQPIMSDPTGAVLRGLGPAGSQERLMRVDT